MPRSLPLERATTVLLDSFSQQYVCRRCIAQARSRALHTTSSKRAAVPFWKRLQESFLGKAEDKAAIEERKRLKEERSELERAMVDTVEIDGVQYERAPLVERRTHDDYVASDNWKGLTRIGSEKWVKAQADQGEYYSSSISKARLPFSNYEWRNILRHTLIELLVLLKSKRSLHALHHRRLQSNSTLTHTKDVWIRYNATMRSIDLQFSSADGEKDLLRQLTEGALLRAIKSVKHEARSIAQGGPSTQDHEKRAEWLNIPIPDYNACFAINGRIAQLTGHRLSDFEMSKAKTMNDIYNALIAKCAPKELAKTKQVQFLAENMPNVTIRHRRVTPIDKDQDVGRWKVIEEELTRRGLPVTGSNWINAKINAKARA